MPKLGNLTKMAARPTGHEVYEDLRGKIVRGELRPREALSEASTAEKYGISRTPLRGVFWRLVEDGFLRIVPQVGTFVAPISIAAVRDSQFIRETLECRAVADAARVAAPADIAALRNALSEQARVVQARDFTAFFALDEAMHRHLMDMAEHPFVWPVIAGAKGQLDRVRFLSLEEPDWLEMILDQHSALIDRVAARDANGATAIMQQHLRTAFAAIDRIAAQHADFFEEAVARSPASRMPSSRRARR